MRGCGHWSVRCVTHSVSEGVLWAEGNYGIFPLIRVAVTLTVGNSLIRLRIDCTESMAAGFSALGSVTATVTVGVFFSVNTPYFPQQAHVEATFHPWVVCSPIWRLPRIWFRVQDSGFKGRLIFYIRESLEAIVMIHDSWFMVTVTGYPCDQVTFKKKATCLANMKNISHSTWYWFYNIKWN